MLYKSLKCECYKKNYSFKLNVQDDTCDACETVNITVSGGEVLASTCFGGSSHEHLLSESSRPFM
jgi:Zn finger protein HypA/HybF involved in hydrogenase expression